MNLHSIKPAKIFFFTRFEKPIPFSVNVINPLLQINNSETVRPQTCLPGAEN